MNESIRRLEEKIAYLERHVTAQDKAMLELAEDVAAMRRAVKALQERARSGLPESDGSATDPRPPHY